MAATRGVTVTASAPGKLILFGEHAVVYGATAIAGALSDLRVHVRASMEPTAAVAISLLRFGEPPGGGGGGGGAYGGDSGSGGGGEGRRDGALPPPPALVVTVAELAAAVAAAAPELRGAREAPPARPPPALVAALGGLLAAAVDTAVARAGEAAAAAAAAGRGDGAAATAATAAAAAPATAADVFGAPAPDVVKAATAPLFLLAAVFAAELATGALPGASVAVTHCTLPVAAGLGSSAALSVAAAAAALGAWAAVAAPPPAAPPSPADANAWAFCAECLFHGAPSGLDNTVSALGGSLAYVRASGGAPARVSPLESLPPLRLLVVNTRVPKNTAALVAGVRALRDAEPRVVDRTLDAVAAVADAVQALVAARGGGGGRAAAGIDRVACGGAGGAEPAADGARAVGASGAAGAAAGTQPLMLEEHAALARLVRLNHGLLVALGVSHPALDAVVAAAGARGWPAKLTGAGGGGCALVLLPPRPAAPGAAADADAAAVAALERELRGAGCAVFATALGGRGLVVEGAGEGAGGAAGE